LACLKCRRLPDGGDGAFRSASGRLNLSFWGTLSASPTAASWSIFSALPGEVNESSVDRILFAVSVVSWAALGVRACASPPPLSLFSLSAGVNRLPLEYTGPGLGLALFVGDLKSPSCCCWCLL